MSTHYKHSNTRTISNIALYIAILCVSSYIIIPLPFTPVVLSLQTLVVNIIGLTLKPKHAATTISIYLLMGLIGLPVFSGATSGPGKLFGPTGGFYFGFLFAVFMISILKGREIHFGRYLLIILCVGLPLQHLAGIAMMCFHNGFNIHAALTAVTLPFLPGDIVKCVLAAYIATTLNKRLTYYYK